MKFNGLNPPTGFKVAHAAPRYFTFAVFLLLLMSTSCNEEEEGLIDQSEIHQWRYFRESHGLASNYIYSIFEDSKGNFWIATDKGLSFYDGKKFKNYTTADGMVSNNIFAVSEDRDGDIWVGSANGLNVFVEDQWLYFPYFYGVPIYSLLELADEKGVLIGTGGYGIYRYRYEESEFDEFHYVDGCQTCNVINSIFQAKDKSIWLASYGGARKINGNTITSFTMEDGLAGSIATTIAEDSWGNIWIGSIEGRTISKISGNTISAVSFNNGASQNFIFGIQEDNDGNLWVGTVGNGLFLYDGALMTQIYKGPPDNIITALRKDSRGNLWIGTFEGGIAQYITNPAP
jgi:ligand-binding sensor domain-containing protein